MSKFAMAMAICGALSGCATPQADTAQEQAQDCVVQTEEATGSRVESTRVCPSEEPGNSTE